FDYYGEKPIEMTDGGFERLAERYKIKKKADVSLEFSEVVKTAIENREWQHFSTKGDVLQEYSRRGNELAPLILEHRGVATIWSTFIHPVADRLDVNNLIHCSYYVGGTVTGRLSSANPNNQNIPSAAKGLYKSRFSNGVIMQFDYSQIELRVAACVFGEPKMIQAYLILIISLLKQLV
ncbi:MAG: hypothetical protein GY869_32695, partial [Planctomycetes bacterium]|nr:hypothetical protein [Planctomycetota bacterium]